MSGWCKRRVHTPQPAEAYHTCENNGRNSPGAMVYIHMYQLWPAEHTCDRHMYMSTPARSRALQRQDVMFP